MILCVSRTTHKVPTGSLFLTEHLCAFGLQVSHDILLQLSSSYMAADAYPHPLADLVCQGESKDLHSYFEQSVQNLLKESSEKFKGWLSTPGPLNTELSCKKVNATVWRGLKTCREMCMGGPLQLPEQVAPHPSLASRWDCAALWQWSHQ